MHVPLLCVFQAFLLIYPTFHGDLKFDQKFNQSINHSVSGHVHDVYSIANAHAIELQLV